MNKTYIIHNVVIGIAQGRHEQLIPERCAVGLAIEQTHGTIGPGLHRLANDFHGPLIGSRALQKPTITSEDFLGRVSRHGIKVGSGKYDGIIGELWIGQDKALLPRGQRLHE